VNSRREKKKGRRRLNEEGRGRRAGGRGRWSKKRKRNTKGYCVLVWFFTNGVCL
jgi:hypothetical protein